MLVYQRVAANTKFFVVSTGYIFNVCVFHMIRLFDNYWILLQPAFLKHVYRYIYIDIYNYTSG